MAAAPGGANGRRRERLRGEGVGTLGGLARALAGRGVPTPSGAGAWTHTTVARVLARAAADG